jgi:putative transposase
MGRVMQRLGLQAIQPKRFVPQATNSQHRREVSPNLLLSHDQSVSTAERVMVGDITYSPLQQGGWCYLAIWQDAFSKQIIGWAVESSMTKDLVITALKKAAHGRHLKAGRIIHSDQGSQYTSTAFRQLLAHYQLRQSMSRRANCYDNAQAESFFARFKTELLEGGSFANLEQARSETFSYIEGHYNLDRRHSALCYQTPLEFIHNLNHSTTERTTETSLFTFS